MMVSIVPISSIPPGLVKAMETVAEAMRPYQDAMDVIEKQQHWMCHFGDSLTDRLRAIDVALTNGIFNDALAQSVSSMLTTYHDVLNIQTSMDALDDFFREQVKPYRYLLEQNVPDLFAVPLLQHDVAKHMQVKLEPFLQSLSSIDTTWLQEDSNWLVEKSTLASLDIGKLDGLYGAFSNLCRLEQQSSLLEGMSSALTSAASQIGSITIALEQSLPAGFQYNDLQTTIGMLSDYCNLATEQHEMLQKATDTSEIEWRLGVLDAASRYIDRQVTWSIGFAEALSDQEITREAEEGDLGSSAISFIPTYIAYTRRKNVKKTPREGLEKSSLVVITEKGKKIVNNVIKMNKLRLDNGEDRIFPLSETIVCGMISIANLICSTDEHLGTIIDGLYSMFYENIKHIKVLIGDGNENDGDDQIRRDSIYQCIFSVKTIRNDLRHDLDHGDGKDRNKKLKSVGDCYRSYCGHRPLTKRDYRKLQEKLYDEIIELEVSLIRKLIYD